MSEVSTEKIGNYNDAALSVYFNKKKISKRDGTLVEFDREKIVEAIAKAGNASREFDKVEARKLTEEVIKEINIKFRETTPNVENIQDIVEDILINSKYYTTGKDYKSYRDCHTKIRKFIHESEIKLVDQYLKKDSWRYKDNSNMGFSLQGLNNNIVSNVSKNYWLRKKYTPKICAAHINGDFYIHDLGLLSVYCVGWDLQDLIREGFKGVYGKIASKPANHFHTILGQVVNFFYTLQGEASGAQAFSNFDTLLAPFIHYDGLTEKEVYQALQEFIFNMNVPTRVGFQSPFTNISFDLVPPQTLAEEPVIIGGKAQDKTYSEFQKEMDMFNEIFLQVLSKGDANGRAFTFPITSYNITKDFDWDSPNREILWEITAKYGIPCFANFINSDMDPNDVRSMCCRLRIDNRELRSRGGGSFGANPLTGSIGVVSINIPRIGILAKNDSAKFFEILGEKMELAKESLEIKRKTIEEFTENGLYPYTSFYLRDVYKRNKFYWYNHFSTIGLIGLNEACLNFLGKNIASKKGQCFALEVLDFMRNKLAVFQKETMHMYNLEATPAESATQHLAELDLKKFRGQKINFAPSINNIPMYTNSSQLPVDYTNDPFESLDLQDDLQAKYTGGTTLNLYLGEAMVNSKAVKKLVQKICTNYQIPYFTITPTFSVCSIHGYLSGKHDSCPYCKQQTEIYSRVVGYITAVDSWPSGKKAEFSSRKTFVIEG